MSTGFNDGRSAFGIPEQPRSNQVPAPGDWAQQERGGVAGARSEMLADDRRSRRRKMALISAVAALLAFTSLFVDAGHTRFFDPAEVFACYGIWIQQAIASFASPHDMLTVNEILADHMEYLFIVNRVSVTLMTVICGGALAIAGALYQSVFRNPIASPSMLGVSSAIQLGDVILVLTYGATAATKLGQRYAICYICVIALMIVLFASTRLMTGRKQPLNVVNLLLVAMILNQLIGVVVTYATTYIFTWDMWEVYNNLSESLTVQIDAISWITLLASCAIGLIPIVALRFRLNGLNFPDADMKLLGINATRLRVVALLCGTVLLMATQVQMGTVAMLALVIPHLSRMIFGAEFRKSIAGDVVLGAALLTACRVILGFIPFVGTFVPISVILNFVVLPFFVWMIAVQQRGWES